MEIVSLIIGVAIGWAISRYYYVRAKTDSDSAEATREEREAWRRSVSYFEHMLSAGRWGKRYIDNLVTWVCLTDTALKIVIPDSTEDFSEVWTERHPNPRGRRTDVQLRVNDSTISELPFVHVDGGRILVPMPRQVFVGSIPAYFWECDSIEFKVGTIIGRYYIYKTIEGVATRSDISIVRGQGGV